MRAPDFWRHDGLGAHLLAPIGWSVARAARARHALRQPWCAPVPVICVGNLVAGGAGKTPVALAIGAMLAGDGAGPHFLTRGYGGTEAGPVRVEPGRHGARDVGDEALLLACRAPTWVSRDRVAGARAAVAAGAGTIVMDDGFQNPSLAKDLSLVVVDGGYGFGNGRPMPAGPLREDVADGLARADAVVLTGDDTTGIEARLGAALPLLRARIVPAAGSELPAGRDVVAFCGIGRPEKFFLTLREMGCRIVSAHGFPDHHPYRAEEVMALVEKAAALGATPVTTAKDAVRLAPETRAMVAVLDVVIEWEAPDAVAAMLAGAVAGGRAARDG